jgi:hypothetical protein
MGESSSAGRTWAIAAISSSWRSTFSWAPISDSSVSALGRQVALQRGESLRGVHRRRKRLVGAEVFRETCYEF